MGILKATKVININGTDIHVYDVDGEQMFALGDICDAFSFWKNRTSRSGRFKKYTSADNYCVRKVLLSDDRITICTLANIKGIKDCFENVKSLSCIVDLSIDKIQKALDSEDGMIQNDSTNLFTQITDACRACMEFEDVEKAMDMLLECKSAISHMYDECVNKKVKNATVVNELMNKNSGILPHCMQINPLYYSSSEIENIKWCIEKIIPIATNMLEICNSHADDVSEYKVNFKELQTVLPDYHYMSKNDESIQKVCATPYFGSIEVAIEVPDVDIRNIFNITPGFIYKVNDEALTMYDGDNIYRFFKEEK